MPILSNDNYRKTKNLLAGIYEVRQAPWWLPSGISEGDVLAAYQFKGAVSETYSFYNLVNSSAYLLSKNNAGVTWTIDKGVFIPAIRAAGLTGFNQGYVTCAIRFSDVDTSANTEIGLTSPIDGYYLMAKFANLGRESVVYYKVPGFSNGKATGQSASRSNESMPNGVLSYTRSLGKLYQNGQLKSLTTYNWDYADVGHPVSIGNATRQAPDWYRTMGTVYIQAAVFYNVALSDSQHVELAEKMNLI